MSRVHLTESQRRWLEAMLARGSTDGAISAEQAELIAGQFETESQSTDRFSRATAFGMALMSVILLTAGILFCLQYEPAQFSPTSKVIILLSLFALVQLLGGCLQVRGRPRGAELAIWFGCLLGAAGTAELCTHPAVSSPSFLMNLDRPDRIFFLTLLPVALFADSLIIHVLLVTAVAMMGYIDFASNSTQKPILLDVLHLEPLCLIPAVIWGYRRHSGVLIGIVATLLVVWILAELFRWDSQGMYVVFAAGWLGVILLLVAEFHPRGSAFLAAYRLPAVLLLGTALNCLGLEAVWNGLGHDTRSTGKATTPGDILANHLICQSLAVIANSMGFAVLARQFWLRREAGQTGWEMATGLMRQLWFPLVMSASMGVATVWHCSSLDGLGLWIVPINWANLAVLAMAVYLLDAGVRERELYLVASGGVGLLRVLYSMAANSLQTFGGLLGTGLLLGLFAMLLMGMAVVWLRTQPSRRDRMLEQESPVSCEPAWFQRMVGWWSRRAVLWLTCALVFQVSALGAYAGWKLWPGTSSTVAVPASSAPAIPIQDPYVEPPPPQPQQTAPTPPMPATPTPASPPPAK